MSSVWVYITAGSLVEARKVGRALIEARLAACVNILENMRSMYHWKGKVEEDREVVLIAKTRNDLVAPLTEAVTAAHGYDVPCVVSLPITGGNPDFLAWIRAETSGEYEPR